MSQEGFQGTFRRGLMPLLVLSLLSIKDMYGYQLVQEAEARSGGAIVVQEGSLYPALYKLLESGEISDRRVLVGKRMTRIYYHLEPAGSAHLKELIDEYLTITGGMFRILREENEQKQAK